MVSLETLSEDQKAMQVEQTHQHKQIEELVKAVNKQSTAISESFKQFQQKTDSQIASLQVQLAAIQRNKSRQFSAKRTVSSEIYVR